MNPQKPLWRAFQKDPERVERWVKEEYPKILGLAGKLKADIFFGDEAGVRSDFHSGKTWAVHGKTPILPVLEGLEPVSKVQKLPSLVRSFFGMPATVYAAIQ